MLRRRTFALLAALAALGFPATSLAQSAGDDQYVDPIPADNGSGSSGSTGSSGGNSGSSGSSTPSAPSTPSTPTTSGTTATPQAAGAEGAPGELPRTGFDVIVTIELGLALLLTGLVSQRMLALRERRDQR